MGLLEVDLGTYLPISLCTYRYHRVVTVRMYSLTQARIIGIYIIGLQPL